MKWRPIIIAGLASAAVAGLVIWLAAAALRQPTAWRQNLRDLG